MIDRLTRLAAPARLQREFDRLFGDFFETPAFPRMNVLESEQSLVVEAEVPGLTLEEIEVNLVGRELTLKGERKQQAPEGAYHHLRERGAGAFEKTLHLPFGVEAEQVKAQLRNGVLEITLPKAADAKPRRIKVDAANSNGKEVKQS